MIKKLENSFTKQANSYQTSRSPTTTPKVLISHNSSQNSWKKARKSWQACCRNFQRVNKFATSRSKEWPPIKGKGSIGRLSVINTMGHLALLEDSRNACNRTTISKGVFLASNQTSKGQLNKIF